MATKTESLPGITGDSQVQRDEAKKTRARLQRECQKYLGERRNLTVAYRRGFGRKSPEQIEDYASLTEEMNLALGMAEQQKTSAEWWLQQAALQPEPFLKALVG